jgi:hypothetical protein
MTQLQEIGEGDHEGRTHFVTVFCGQDMMMFLTKNLHFSLMKLDSI